MKRKCIGIIIMLLIIIFDFMFFTDCVYASGTITFGGWNEIYENPGNAFDTAQNVIVGLVQVIGYIVSVIMVTIIGIKYIFTSPEGKAEVKKQLIPFLIGALLLFSATTLVSIISTWAYKTI